MNANRIFGIVTVLVIGAILGLGWFLGVSPLLAQAVLADADRAAVEQTNLAETAKLEQMRTVYEGLPELEKELAELRVSIPGEVDSDFIYTLFADIQASSGAQVKTISTSEAVPYGTVSAGADAGVPAPAPTDGSTPTPTQSAPAEFYTVPLTISFESQPLASVFAFAEGLQASPRLFLVTSVVADSTASGTITAYMFVMRDDDAPRAAAYLELNGLLNAKVADKVEPEPEPEPTPTPGETGTPTPTPTPTP